jgi:hypothetical protein
MSIYSYLRLDYAHLFTETSVWFRMRTHQRIWVVKLTKCRGSMSEGEFLELWSLPAMVKLKPTLELLIDFGP